MTTIFYNNSQRSTWTEQFDAIELYIGGTLLSVWQIVFLTLKGGSVGHEEERQEDEHIGLTSALQCREYEMHSSLLWFRVERLWLIWSEVCI